MNKKSDEKRTHKLTPKARDYVLEALALALSPEEIIGHLQAEFDISIAARTVWYHSQNSRGEIIALRKTFNTEVKERFPFASVCVRLNELQRLYHRASELENQMTYSSDKSEGRNMLKESIELRAKILKQVNEEISHSRSWTQVHNRSSSLAIYRGWEDHTRGDQLLDLNLRPSGYELFLTPNQQTTPDNKL